MIFVLIIPNGTWGLSLCQLRAVVLSAGDPVAVEYAHVREDLSYSCSP